MIGMATKKIIVVPCIVNIRLNTSGDTKSLCGTDELDPHDGRFHAAEDEEQQRVKDVQKPEPFVIDRRHPLVKPFHEGAARRSGRQAI